MRSYTTCCGGAKFIVLVYIDNDTKQNILLLFYYLEMNFIPTWNHILIPQGFVFGQSFL